MNDSPQHAPGWPHIPSQRTLPKEAHSIREVKKMMNSWMSRAAMSLLLPLGVASVSPAQSSLSIAVRKSELSVVAIYAYDSQDKILGQGNGFFITKEGHLITCRNFLEGADHARVPERRRGCFTR